MSFGHVLLDVKQAAAARVTEKAEHGNKTLQRGKKRTQRTAHATKSSNQEGDVGGGTSTAAQHMHT